jgi:hypothetical protein
MPAIIEHLIVYGTVIAAGVGTSLRGAQCCLGARVLADAEHLRSGPARESSDEPKPGPLPGCSIPAVAIEAPRRMLGNTGHAVGKPGLPDDSLALAFVSTPGNGIGPGSPPADSPAY